MEQDSACSFPELTLDDWMFEGHSLEKQEHSLQIGVSWTLEVVEHNDVFCSCAAQH